MIKRISEGEILALYLASDIWRDTLEKYGISLETATYVLKQVNGGVHPSNKVTYIKALYENGILKLDKTGELLIFNKPIQEYLHKVGYRIDRDLYRIMKIKILSYTPITWDDIEKQNLASPQTFLLFIEAKPRDLEKVIKRHPEYIPYHSLPQLIIYKHPYIVHRLSEDTKHAIIEKIKSKEYVVGCCPNSTTYTVATLTPQEITSEESPTLVKYDGFVAIMKDNYLVQVDSLKDKRYIVYHRGHRLGVITTGGSVEDAVSKVAPVYKEALLILDNAKQLSRKSRDIAIGMKYFGRDKFFIAEVYVLGVSRVISVENLDWIKGVLYGIEASIRKRQLQNQVG